MRLENSKEKGVKNNHEKVKKKGWWSRFLDRLAQANRESVQ
jgi:hypothetical protein